MAIKNNTYIIIQARMTSTRLPGKVMLPLHKSTVLETLLLRLGRLQKQVIIATTDDGSEQPIVELCERLNIRYYRGSTDDVLGRYYQAAVKFGAEKGDAIVRLTSDCPLVTGDIIQRVLNVFSSAKYDSVSLGPHSGFPWGIDAHVFGFHMLERLHQQCSEPHEREHVTLGMRTFKGIRKTTIENTPIMDEWRLTLDEPDDYRLITELFQRANDADISTYHGLQSFLRLNPDLHAINSHVNQLKF